MRTFSRTNQFKKDVKRAERRGKDMAKLKAMYQRVIDGAPLSSSSPFLGREPTTGKLLL